MMNKPSGFEKTLFQYVIGFGAALSLSLVSYFAISYQWFDSSISAMTFLLLFATIQLAVQLICFLHLGSKESRPQSQVLIFTAIMALIILVGSIWIMNNLNYRMHVSPEAMEDYMIEQNRKGF